MKKPAQKKDKRKHAYGDCSFCGGQVRQKTTELDYRRKGKLYVFLDVPAGVCVQCGEKFLTAEAAKKIEKKILSKEKCGKTISVPAIQWA